MWKEASTTVYHIALPSSINDFDCVFLPIAASSEVSSAPWLENPPDFDDFPGKKHGIFPAVSGWSSNSASSSSTFDRSWRAIPEWS